MTYVSELLYRNIVSQSGTPLWKIPSKAMNRKKLFLFGGAEKSRIHLHFWTRARRQTGAVT